MRKLNVHKGKRSLLWLQTLIVVVTLIAVAIVIFFDKQTFRETKKMSTEQFNQQQLILARSAANGINSYFQGLVNELSSLANIPEVQQMTPECLKYMQHSYYGFPPRTSIRRLDSNGVLRMIYPVEDWRGEMYDRDYSHEAYFQEAMEKECISIHKVINEQGEARIRIAVPVYLTNKTETVEVGDETGIIVRPVGPERPESGRFVGVLVGSFDPKMIARKIISPIVSGKTGYAWLLDRDSIFLAHHEKEFIGKNAFEVRKEINPDISYEAVERIQKKMIAGEEGVGRYISGWHRSQKGKVEKLVAYTPIYIDNNIFSVAVCAPVSEVEEIIHLTKSSEKYTISFVILALIIGGLCSFIIIYRWSHSLELEVAKQTRVIKETGNYLNNLIKHTHSPIIVWDQDKKVTIFNEAFEKISGRTEAEMMNQPLEILFPEESCSDSMQKIETISKGEYWESVEIPILHKDGNIRVALWNSANIYAEDGTTILSTIIQGIDITERKKMEFELIRLSDAFRMSIDSIVISDLDGKITDVNEATLKIYGTDDIVDLVGKNSIDLIAPEDKEKAVAGMKEVMEKEYIKYQEYHIVIKDGSKIPVEMSTSIMKGLDGEPIGFVGVTRDITERKQAEEALREKEIYTRAIFEQSPISIQIFNKDGLTLDTNRAWGELWQLPSDELIGKYNVLEDEYAREIGGLDDIEKAFKGETSLPFEMEYDPVKSGNPGRKRNLKCVVFPIKNDNGEVNRVVLMHEDITEHKKAEEELTKHRDHFEELVRERTKELEDKNKELKHFNDLFVGREFRIKELRDRVKELEEEEGRRK